MKAITVLAVIAAVVSIIASQTAAIDMGRAAAKLRARTAARAGEAVTVGELPYGDLRAVLTATFVAMNREVNTAIGQAVMQMADAADADMTNEQSAFRFASVDTSLDTDLDVELGTMSVASVQAMADAMSTAQFTAFEAMRAVAVHRAWTDAYTGMEQDAEAAEGAEFVTELTYQTILDSEVDMEGKSEAEWPSFLDKAVSSVVSTVKSAASSVSAGVKSAIKAVKNVDINKLASKVSEVAGKVGSVASVVAKVGNFVKPFTSAIPYVGAAVNGITAAASTVEKVAKVVKAGADIVKGATRPGETLAEAMGRAKDAVVSTVKKGVDFAKQVVNDPLAAAKAVGNTIKKGVTECVSDPSKCVDKVAGVAKTVATLAGKEDLVAKIEKGQEMAHKAISGVEAAKAGYESAKQVVATAGNVIDKVKSGDYKGAFETAKDGVGAVRDTISAVREVISSARDISAGVKELRS